MLDRRKLGYLSKLRRHMCPNCAIFLFMSTLEIILSISVVASGSVAFDHTICWVRASSPGRQGNPGRLRHLLPDASNVR